MDWQDQAIILSTRTHGESSVIVELLTETHGRHLGIVRGGRGKQLRPVLQPGNRVEAHWQARLAEHLGMVKLDPARLRAAEIMVDPLPLMALQSVCVLAGRLAEREPHPRQYLATELLLEALAEGAEWQPMLVHWELRLLAELGYGLDLDQCAATGGNDALIYVSPKSGRAVSASAGEPYRDKLLSLPNFLRDMQLADVPPAELADGLRLTGYFLEKHLYTPAGTTLPEVRLRLEARLKS